MIYTFDDYIGKKLAFEFSELERMYRDIETNDEFCTKYLDRRPYLSKEETQKIEESNAEEYDERLNWELNTFLTVYADDENTITDIEIGAEVYAYRDDGLGGCDPYDEWTQDDYNAAEDFLKSITE